MKTVVPALFLLFGSLAVAQGDDTSDELRLVADARQLTFVGKRAGESYFSADGARIAYQAEREPGNPYYQIYSMDLATGAVTRISTGAGKTTCAWFLPDASGLIFASTHDDAEFASKVKAELAERASGGAKRYAWDYDSTYEIYRRDLASNALTRLTDALGYDAECSMSPDGKRIAFSSNRHAYAAATTDEARSALAKAPDRALEIYVMDANGANPTRLTDCEGYDGGPMWSPDGKRLCWRRFSVDGTTAEIWSMDADGANARQLTRLGAMSWAPFFHPSGDYLIFATNRHGFANFELYLVDAAGAREPVRVTTTPGFDGLSSFAPDGARLTWTSTRGASGQAQVWLARWDHARARELLGLAPAASDAAEADAAAQANADVAASDARPVAADMRRYVERLTSDAMDGRLTGTDGERRATAYVAAAFARLGLAPAGDDGGWFEAFAFTQGVGIGAASRLELRRPGVRPAPLTVETDWRPLAFSAAGEVSAADVAYVGYGIVAPAAAGQPAHDDYAGANVKGKWALVLRYTPEDAPAERRQYLARYASLRHKAMVARDKGAVGILVASGPTSRAGSQLVPLQSDATLATASIAAVSITDALAGELIAAGGGDLATLQKTADAGDATKVALACGPLKVEAAVAIERVEGRGRSVLGRLRAKAAPADAPYVVVCAHVDHLGRSADSSSRARPEERGRTHRGADDNASGVAALLEIAQHLTARQAAGELTLARDIVFAAWSGEELGLIGSTQHAQRVLGGAESPRRAIAAVLNLDMVGRYRGELQLQGAGSSPVWAELVERAAAPAGLGIALAPDAYLPTDSTPFYVRGVPTLSAFTGTHDEYHTPRDTPDTLDYPAAARIADLVATLAQLLGERSELLDYVRLAAPERGPTRTGARVRLGTIPAYGGTGPGVLLDGVSKGGAAEKAGLAAGDRIVELGGKKIDNLYDYTFAIEQLRPGTAVEVVVLRAEQRVTLTLTPASRE